MHLIAVKMFFNECLWNQCYKVDSYLTVAYLHQTNWSTCVILGGSNYSKDHIKRVVVCQLPFDRRDNILLDPLRFMGCSFGCLWNSWMECLWTVIFIIDSIRMYLSFIWWSMASTRESGSGNVIKWQQIGFVYCPLGA